MPLAADEQDAGRQAAIDYVNGLASDCTYDHGYQCAEIQGDDFLAPDSEARRVPGPWLEAWPAALTALVTSSELSTEQKQLRHYKIGFAEDETHYIVLFDALSLPMIEDGEVVGILQSGIGLGTKVWVDKKTLSVTDMKFLR